MNSLDNGRHVNQRLAHSIKDVQDERYISLIDLWIELIRFKAVFLKSFAFFLSLGAVFLVVLHEDRYTLASMIQIGSVQVNDQIAPLESPEALRGKLTSVIVPLATASWSERFKTGGDFRTDVELVEGGNIVLIKNKGTLADIDFFTKFQKSLAEQIMQEHSSKLSVYQSGTRSALNVARLRLEVLRDRQVLDNQLKLIDAEIAEHKAYMETLISAQQTEPETTVHRTGQLGFSEDRAKQQQVVIRDLEFKKIELLNEHTQELMQQKSIVHDLERSLQDVDHTRVISEPVRSLAPVNLSVFRLFVIMAVVASALASLITLLALFNEKVKIRRAELAG